MDTVKHIGIVCIWIALWAIAACAIGSPIILASPWDTVCALGAAMGQIAFWKAIGGTFWHIVVGLAGACVIGCAAGVAAARWHAFDAFVSPAMHFIKSAPIVCFIVLLLVWFGSDYVDLAAVLLAVLPVYYFSMSEAYRQRDAKRVDMLRVFRVPLAVRIRVFEWPNARPFFTQSTKIATGMAWKSGVTAELIGLTFASIGEQIYLAKLTLDTAGLLAWTIVIVVLSWACEKLVLYALGRVGQRMPRQKPGWPGRADESLHAADAPHEGACGEIRIENVGHSFDGRTVLDGVSLVCAPGSRTCIMASTGAGKTTLLNVVMGLVRPDAGRVVLSHPTSGRATLRISAVFQEERLLNHLTAEHNMTMVSPCDSRRACMLLEALLDKPACEQTPAELSGGMKRCVEICRALAAPSECVVMDEPFVGLDQETKQRAISLIQAELRGRTLLLVTHDRSDADELGCDVFSLEQLS